ncbi:MAG: hypothetical protein R2863_04980 [Candidatus Kapaibacterium sp.]|nr:hypothetical protein [Ignavibacteriota bacterium]
MNKQTAIKIMLGFLTAILIFHFCILLKIIPYDITWGGRLTNDSEMYVFETFSILLNLILYIALLIKGKFIKEIFTERIVNIVLWIFIVFFGLNTIGNLFAETLFEKFFSIITLLFVFLLWVIVKKSKT